MRSIKDNSARTDGDRGSAVVVAPEAALTELSGRARAFAKAARAKNTTRAYTRQQAAFAAWCEARNLPSLPAEPAVLAAYLAHLADHGARAGDGASVATMAQALSAIGDAHRRARLPSPVHDLELAEVWEGIKREKGRAQRKARPLSPKEIRTMIRALRPGLKAARDRALVLVGFAGALRREEIVDIWVEHIEWLDDGRARLAIPRSKGDQYGQGQHVMLPRGSDRLTCPISAIEDWLALSGITAGPVFRGIQYGKLTANRLNPGDVAKILKSAAKRAGVPVKHTSGHSLRRGLATTARREGRSLDAIQRQVRHANVNTTMGYLEAADLELAENAAEGIGL